MFASFISYFRAKPECSTEEEIQTSRAQSSCYHPFGTFHIIGMEFLTIKSFTEVMVPN